MFGFLKDKLKKTISGFSKKIEEEGKEEVVEEPVINRVALHAYSIEFKHPTKGKLVRFEAPLPADMQRLLDMLREYRKK